MPACYLLAMCQASALDSGTNNFSLFSLVEQLASSRLPFQIPFETHIYWKLGQAESNVDFEFRLVLVGPDGNEQRTRSFDLRSETPRFRQRIQGLPDIHIPMPGYYELAVEWRQRGTDAWTRAPTTWPVQVDPAPQTAGAPTVVPDT